MSAPASCRKTPTAAAAVPSVWADGSPCAVSSGGLDGVGGGLHAVDLVGVLVAARRRPAAPSRPGPSSTPRPGHRSLLDDLHVLRARSTTRGGPRRTAQTSPWTTSPPRATGPRVRRTAGRAPPRRPRSRPRRRTSAWADGAGHGGRLRHPRGMRSAAGPARVSGTRWHGRKGAGMTANVSSAYLGCDAVQAHGHAGGGRPAGRWRPWSSASSCCSTRWPPRAAWPCCSGSRSSSAAARDRRRVGLPHGAGASFVLGAILVIGGVLAAVWPGVTLFTLALITGLSLIIHGAARVGLALMARHEIPGWGWLVLAGARERGHRGDGHRVARGDRPRPLADPRRADRRLRRAAARLRLRAPRTRRPARRRADPFQRRSPDRRHPTRGVDMPGLLRGMARTAVVAGTATAVSNRVSRRQGTGGRTSRRRVRPGAGAADAPPVRRAPTRTPSSRSCASWPSCATPASSTRPSSSSRRARSSIPDPGPTGSGRAHPRRSSWPP